MSRSLVQISSVMSVVCSLLYCGDGVRDTGDPLLSLFTGLPGDLDLLRSFCLPRGDLERLRSFRLLLGDQVQDPRRGDGVRLLLPLSTALLLFLCGLCRRFLDEDISIILLALFSFSLDLLSTGLLSLLDLPACNQSSPSLLDSEYVLYRLCLCFPPAVICLIRLLSTLAGDSYRNSILSSEAGESIHHKIVSPTPLPLPTLVLLSILFLDPLCLSSRLLFLF